MSGIPIVIGVTGHRDLQEADVPALERAVRAQLAAWMQLCPHTEFLLMTSLAEGADQLCARAAKSFGMRLIVPLPMAAEAYERDFSGEALVACRAFLAEAAESFVAPDTENCGDGSRDYAYRQAGIYVARHCHALIALWDGKPGQPGGCGTAETVDCKLRRAYRTPDTLLTAEDEGVVWQVVTPRASGARPENALSCKLLENAPGTLNRLLMDTDAFNADAAKLDAGCGSDVFDAETMEKLGAAALPINALYRTADYLALGNRDRYLRALRRLCELGMLLVIAFLLYDELEANLFLLLYGGIALLAYGVYRYTKRGGFHKKYMEYRMLSETLRVQMNLLAAGLAVSAEDLMPWSQRTIASWIRETMNTLPGREGKRIECEIDIRRVWMRDQLSYQKRTLEKNRIKAKRQARIANLLLTLTVLYGIAVLTLELLLPAWIGTSIPLPAWLCKLLLSHSADFFSIRSIFKILLGVIPALTLVVSSYYGKLSLRRKLSDGRRMIALYTEACEAYDNPLTDRARLLTELAREELVETGDWLSYVSENQPDILL